MVHTATLTLKPSRTVFEIFTQQPDTYFLKQENIWMNKSFKRYGIVLTGKIYYYDGFAMRSIQCRINFKLATTGCKYHSDTIRISLPSQERLL